MNSATYRGLPCPPTSELVSKGYVLDYLRENGADDGAVQLRNRVRTYIRTGIPMIFNWQSAFRPPTIKASVKNSKPT